LDEKLRIAIGQAILLEREKSPFGDLRAQSNASNRRPPRLKTSEKCQTNWKIGVFGANLLA